MIILCIAIAAASWRYVERPFRYGERRAAGSQRAYFVGGLGALGLAACVGGAIYLGDGLPWRLGPEPLRVYLASGEHNPLRAECLGGSGNKPSAASHCTTPGLKVGNTYDILVWGDSHGDALFPAIAMIGENHGLSTRAVDQEGLSATSRRRESELGWVPKRGRTVACTKYNAALLQELKEGPRPSLVVIAARWSMYAETTTGFARGRRVFLVDDENKQLDIETSRKVLSRALVRTVDAISALGIRVLLIGQPPEFFQNPNVCYVERSILRRDVGDCLREPRQLVDQRLRASKAILQSVASGRSATTYVSLDSVLCDDQVCRTWEGDQPLYEDGTHLDLSGARVIGRALSEMPSFASLIVTQGASSLAAICHLAH